MFFVILLMYIGYRRYVSANNTCILFCYRLVVWIFIIRKTKHMQLLSFSICFIYYGIRSYYRYFFNSSFIDAWNTLSIQCRLHKYSCQNSKRNTFVLKRLWRIRIFSFNNSVCYANNLATIWILCIIRRGTQPSTSHCSIEHKPLLNLNWKNKKKKTKKF